MKKFLLYAWLLIGVGSLPTLLKAAELKAPKFRSGAIWFSKDCPPAAGSSQDVCATDKLPGSSESYLDALRLVFPDIRPDGNASQAAKPTRKDFGQMELSEPGADPSTSKEFLPAGSFSYLAIGEGEAARLLILNRSGGQLGLFKSQPKLSLLDWVGVAQDREVFFSTDQGVYSGGNQGFLIWLSNSHHNAGESYYIYNLMNLAGDKLNLVYDGPMLYSFLIYGGTECRVSQTLGPVPVLARDPSGYPRLAMKVRQEKLCQKGSREVAAGGRDFAATLEWDAAKRKYMGGSKELYQLNRCRIDGGAEKACP